MASRRFLQQLSLLGVVVVMLLTSIILVTHEAKAQSYPDCKCRYYPDLNRDNCDSSRSGNCCPNPCIQTAS